jgi:hypothetical protein
MRSDHIPDPVDAAALQCRRFWLPRGTAPDLSDNGFLVNPESTYPIFTPASAVPLKAFGDLPVLGLLGEPGMGKSTVLNQEALRLQAVVRQSGDRFLQVDLAACGTDVLVCKRIFESHEFRAWKKTKARLHLFLDGFDTCLQYVKTLVALLLERLDGEPLDQLSLRIACRATEWPVDLEAGLIALWQEQNVGIYELAPLRRKDVLAAAEARGLPADGFLREVVRLGAAPFASRPITLKFLLNSFERGQHLPSQRPDLYRQGCLALCDEWRYDRQRTRKFSEGERFAVACRLAAVIVFSQKVAIWKASRREAMPDGDVRVSELQGHEERFAREVTVVGLDVVRETFDTGLFRSIGPDRVGFSHQTYAEYLAAQYLVDHQLSVPEMLQLILHSDDSGKIVPQLRETATWLAALVPDIYSVLLKKDPAALLASDTPPSSAVDRRGLVRQILRLYDSRELLDVQLVTVAGKQQDGACLKYDGIAGDLKPYIADQSRSAEARLAAILIAQHTRQPALQQDLLGVALNQNEPHNIRVGATVALRVIGDEITKAALKPLIAAVDDPDDQLKGAALAATWPEHLSAGELFKALAPAKRTNFIGEYRRFLGSTFATGLLPTDMIGALEWARNHTKKTYAETTPLGRAALSVVAMAIDCFREPQVCDHLADTLVQLAQEGIPALDVMSKLSSNPDARTAIVRKAIRVSQDRRTAWCLRRYGLVEEGDVPLLLAELDAGPPVGVQETIAALIADLLYRASIDSELVQQVLPAARVNPILSAALNPILGYVELHSKDARDQKERYEAERPKPDSTPVPDSAPNLEDLLSLVDSGEKTAFAKICWRLAGDSWYPDDEVLPGWANMQPAVQAQIIRSAQMYLNDYCFASTSWIETGLSWYEVTYGYWALRLLALAAPEVFGKLSDDVWYAWLPSVFDEQRQYDAPDGVEATILKTAYHRSPARFRELLGRVIDAQNKRLLDVSVVDMTTPVWNRAIADLLRAKLGDDQLSPRTFRRVLAALLAAGDAGASQIAIDLVAGATRAHLDEIEKPIYAALGLLNHDPSEGWKVVWPVTQKNTEFAQRLFTHYVVDPHSSEATHLLDGLREDQLAEFLIWLSERCAAVQDVDNATIGGGFRVITPNGGWPWLRTAVTNSLIGRGTPEAVEAIRRIDKESPDEKLKRVEQVAQEVLRQKTWTPLAPSALIDLVTRARALPAHAEAAETKTRKPKPKRQNQRYQTIDEALKQIAASLPRTQKTVFQLLDERKVYFPHSKPFLAARGWLAGFRQDEAAARAWLSKRWAALSLPAFARGPKK